MGNLVSELKKKIAQSGTSKREVLFFAPDESKRVRFLQEFDTGYSFQFHSDFNAKIFTLCLDQDDHEDCKLCNEQIPIQENFAWTVWDYDSNSVKIILTKATGVSPIPAFIEMYEEFGTIMDRDYKIKKVGKGTGSSFTVTPLDKSRFRQKAKPYTESQIEKILKESFKYEENNDDEEETTTSVKRKKKVKKEKTLRSKFEELDMEELKDICLEIGMSKKEFRKFDDEEEVISYLFDEYEEDDLEEILEEMDVDEDEEVDDDDE